MNKENDIKVVKTSTRVTAYLLDILLVFLILNLVTSIKFINPKYDEYVEAYEKYNEITNDYYDGLINESEMIKLNKDNYYNVIKYSVSYNIVIIIGLFAYFGLFQKYNNGQTIGKKIMKIKVVSLDKENLSVGKSLLRCLPMYYLYIGSIIPLVINSILVYIVGSDNYMIINTIISYIFVIINITSLIMLWFRKDKRAIHDIFAKTEVISA